MAISVWNLSGAKCQKSAVVLLAEFQLKKEMIVPQSCHRAFACEFYGLFPGFPELIKRLIVFGVGWRSTIASGTKWTIQPYTRASFNNRLEWIPELPKRERTKESRSRWA